MRGRSSPNPPAPCNGFTIASLLLYVGGLPAVLQYLTVISQLGHIVDDDDATGFKSHTQLGHRGDHDDATRKIQTKTY